MKTCVHCGLWPTIDEWGSLCDRCVDTVIVMHADGPHVPECRCWVAEHHATTEVIE